jgi:hypothetical protein
MSAPNATSPEDLKTLPTPALYARHRDVTQLLAQARQQFGPRAHGVQVLEAEARDLMNECRRRASGGAITPTAEAEDLQKLPDDVLLRRHRDALNRERNLRDAGDAAGADAAKREADELLAEQRRRGKERGNPAA